MKVVIYINDRVFSETQIHDEILQGDSFARAKLIGQLCVGDIAECLDLLESGTEPDYFYPAGPFKQLELSCTQCVRKCVVPYLNDPPDMTDRVIRCNCGGEFRNQSLQPAPNS